MFLDGVILASITGFTKFPKISLNENGSNHIIRVYLARFGAYNLIFVVITSAKADI